MDDFLSNFHFLRPWFLGGLLFVFGILWRMIKHKQNSTLDLHKICDAHLLKAVLDKPEAGAGSQHLHMLLLLVLCLVSVGLAGPSWVKKPIPLFEPQNGRVIVLGLTPSMSETDISPTRFERAKLKALDLINAAPPQFLQALVVYSDDAFVVSPLSDDKNTLLNLLKAIKIYSLPTIGNRADKGLKTAAQLLDQSAIAYREIILISDNAEPLAVEQAQRLRTPELIISVLAIHNSATPPRPVLVSVADAGGGIYAPLHIGEEDIVQLNAHTNQSLLAIINNRQALAAQFKADEFEDRGVWLLALALILSGLLFRKGWLLCLFLMPIILLPKPVSAFEWQDLLLRPDQQAARAFKRKEFDLTRSKEAVKWQAAAAYRDEDYAAAADYYGRGNSADARYNLGTALAKAGKYQLALDAYAITLKIQPQHPKARHNQNIVRQLLQQQLALEEKLENVPQNRDGESSEQQAGSRQEERQTEQQSEEELAEEEGEEAQTSSQKGAKDKSDQATTSDDGAEDDEMQLLASVTQTEEQQALEQWLRKLSDNPGELLIRKFKIQYQSRQKNAQ